MEGSISVAGLALNWLKNNLNLISDFQECEKLAAPVTCTGGVYFVPAFSGLYAPLLENGYQRVRFKKINKLTELPIPVIFNTFTNDEIIQSRWRIDPVYYPGSFGSYYFRICVLSNKRHCWSNGSRRWCSYDVASFRWWNSPKQSFDPAPSRHSRHSNRYVSSCQIRSTSFRDNL